MTGHRHLWRAAGQQGIQPLTRRFAESMWTAMQSRGAHTLVVRMQHALKPCSGTEDVSAPNLLVAAVARREASAQPQRLTVADLVHTVGRQVDYRAREALS